jgi:hypothetical protein
MRSDVINEEIHMLGKKSLLYAPLAATAALLLVASPAVADPDFVISAEDSCGTFDLGLKSTGGTIREIKFDNGNLYKVGSGVILTWSNEGLPGQAGNGKTYTVNTSGSVTRYVKNPDGKSYTMTLTGHNGVVLFHTDAGGPGAFVYTGRVVLTVDNPKDNNVSEVISTAGKAVNVCDLLK